MQPPAPAEAAAAAAAAPGGDDDGAATPPSTAPLPPPPLTVQLGALRLAPDAPLRAAPRAACPRCGRSRCAFCCGCLVWLLPDAALAPVRAVLPRAPQWPVEVHVVVHGETDAQATGTHAALLGGCALHRHRDGTSHHRRCRVVDLPLPHDWRPDDTCVLYPHPDAPVVGLGGRLLPPGSSVSSLSGSGSSSGSGGSSAAAPPFPFKRVVVLESTYAKARAMLAHPTLAPLSCVQLPSNVRTVFWRRGKGTHRGAVDSGLSTIEAVWFLLRLLAATDGGGGGGGGGDVDEEKGGSSSVFDNLLWLFVYQRTLVAERGSAQTKENTLDNERRWMRLQQQSTRTS